MSLIRVLRQRHLAVDLTISSLIPFVAVWFYEASNWIVLTAQGNSVSFSLSGWVPTGVVGTSTAILSPLTKFAQMAIAIGLLAPLRSLLSRNGLRFAEILATSAAGIYLTSAYWEYLSELNFVEPVVHLVVFVAGTVATVLVLLSLVYHGQAATPSEPTHPPNLH